MLRCNSGWRAFAASNHFFLVLLLLVMAVLSSIFSGCASVARLDVPSSSISVIPAAVDFKAVVVGQKNSQTLTVTNTSDSAIHLTSVHVSGSNFLLASSKAPLILAPNTSSTLSVVFAPSKAATMDGSLVLDSPNLEKPYRVPLTGAGEKAEAALQETPSSVSFGTRSISSSSFQTVTVKNTGNVKLKIGSATMSTGVFSTSGISAGVSLDPGQQLSFQVWFRPTASGSWSGTLALSSPSLSSAVKLAISGAASSAASPPPDSAVAHSVTLDWNASKSSVAGYHVYRGNASGGPYNRIDGSLITGLAYSDSSVESGARYFYVVTAVETGGKESAFSNEVSVEIPN